MPDLSPQASSLRDLGTRLSLQMISFSQICASLKWPFKFLWKRFTPNEKATQCERVCDKREREMWNHLKICVIERKSDKWQPGAHSIKFYTRRVRPEVDHPLTLSVVSFPAISNYVNVFLCFGTRDFRLLPSVTKFWASVRCFRVYSIFPFRRLMVQFDAVAQTNFFKYRLSSMYLYLPVKERWKETVK